MCAAMPTRGLTAAIILLIGLVSADWHDLESLENRTYTHTSDLEKALGAKCEEQEAGDAMEALRAQQATLQACVAQHVNVTNVQQELAEAKKTGSMDEVFAKYCQRWPHVFGCLDNAIVTVRRCLSQQEDAQFNRSLEVGQEIQKFMCFKDGDRLALFVAQGGVECIQEQQQGLKQCFNASMPPSTEAFSFSALPLLAFQAQNCSTFETLRGCVKLTLEQCGDTTPANIVDASFKFLKNQMPCNEQEVALQSAPATPTQSGAWRLAATPRALLALGAFGVIWLDFL